MTTAVEATPVPATPSKKTDIMQNCLLLTLVRRWPPQTKTVSNKILNTNAQSNMIYASKKLFQSREFGKIVNNEVMLDNFIKRRSSPMPLRAGHHLVAVDLFAEVENFLTEHVNRRNPLIDAFVNVYEQVVEKSKEALGDQFRQSDYPTVEQVKGYFYFGWQYLDFRVSDKLEEIDKQIAARKNQQLENEVIHATEIQKQLLRAEMAELVSHLVDRLAPKEVNGELKKKTFRDTILDRITDFKQVFTPRNLAGDSELKKLVDQTEALLTGVTPSTLRSDDGLRDTVHNGFSQIKSQLDSMIINQPIRSIQLED